MANRCLNPLDLEHRIYNLEENGASGDLEERVETLEGAVLELNEKIDDVDDKIDDTVDGMKLRYNADTNTPQYSTDGEEWNNFASDVIPTAMFMKSKTVTATTTASGNLDTGLLIADTTVIGASVNGSDRMASVCSWGSTKWGIHVTGIDASLTPVANTSVTVTIWYVEQQMISRTVNGTTTASGNISSGLFIAQSLPFRAVVYDTTGTVIEGVCAYLCQWSSNMWGYHLVNSDGTALTNTNIRIQIYYLNNKTTASTMSLALGEE